MNDWIDWAERRPTEAKWYWWRTPARDHGGLELQMEFAAKMSLHGMGYADSELWPENVSHWDGYHRTVPAGLQWLEGVEIEEPPKYGHPPVRFPSLSLSPCPFCGNQPKVEAHERPRSGGFYIGAKIHRANHFKIQCCIIHTLEGWDFARIVERWNTRKPEPVDVPPDYEIGFRAQVLETRGWAHMWGLDGEFKDRTPGPLETVCQDHADISGKTTRLVEYRPYLFREFIPNPDRVWE